MFDFTILKNEYEKKLEFLLFKDYGELVESYRKKNEIVHPVCGVFRMQPMVITAIPSPFIGTVSAMIEMVAVPDRLAEVEKKMNDVAASVSGTAFYITDENSGKKYSVTYTVQTAIVGDKVNVAWYHGDVFPIRQTVTYTIVENGLPASEVRIRIDGYTVPVLSVAETRVDAPSVYPDIDGRTHTVSESTSYGLDVSIPALVDDALLAIIDDALTKGAQNRALCVEIEKPDKCDCRIMTIAKVSESVQPPQNVGLTVSLVDVLPEAATYNALWGFTRHEGMYANIPTALQGKAHSVVFWGDGSASRTPENAHIYTDGKESHDIRYVIFDTREKEIAVGDNVGATTVFAMQDIYSDTMTSGTRLLYTADGEGIVSNAGRICVKIGGATVPIDHTLGESGRIGIAKGERIPVNFKSNVTECGSIKLYVSIREQECPDGV